MSPEEYREFYSSLGNSISRRRVTDLNEASTRFILDNLPSSEDISVLDVGAGNGWLLGRLAAHRRWRRIAGVDVVTPKGGAGEFERFSGLLPVLPFADKEFDIVTCTHVIEHLIDVERSVQELLRITKRRLFIVVPRQRYYYYTLDEHLNFYPQIEPLIKLFQQYPVTCMLRDGDWAIRVDVQQQEN